MRSSKFPVDMARCAVVLRCFADFIAARPGLPDLVAVDVVWSHMAETWEVKGQLPHDCTPDDVVRWALVLDDPVTTADERQHAEDEPYLLHTATGTVHGHPVVVWLHLPTGSGR